MALTTPELNLIAQLLREAAEVFASRTCNDYYLPDTPENREILLAIISQPEYAEDYEEEDLGYRPPYGQEGMLGFFDSAIMLYLADRVQREVDFRNINSSNT